MRIVLQQRSCFQKNTELKIGFGVGGSLSLSNLFYFGTVRSTTQGFSREPGEECQTVGNKLDDARRSLQRAKEATNRRLREIESERNELKATLKSLDAAIRALGRPKASIAKRGQVDGTASEAVVPE